MLKCCLVQREYINKAAPVQKQADLYCYIALFSESSFSDFPCNRDLAAFIFQMEIREESCLDLFPPETVVYLTPDADNGLFQRLSKYLHTWDAQPSLSFLHRCY